MPAARIKAPYSSCARPALVLRLSWLVPAVMFFSALIFTFLGACSASNVDGPVSNASLHKRPANTTQTVDTKPKPWHPDRCIVIVNNLESYFEDCGCSGAARGGVARLPSAGFGNIVSCVFTGNTLFEARQLGTPITNETRQLALQANTGTLLLRALPDPRLLSPPGETKMLAELAKRGVNVEFLQSIVSSADAVLSAGIRILVDGKGISVDDGVTWTRFPEHGSRARRVIICAVWDGGARFPIRYTPALDGLAPLCEHSTLAARRVQEIVDESYSHGVGACSVFVQSIDQSMDERAALSRMLEASRVGAAHVLGGPGDSQHGERSAAQADQVVASCGNCHNEALAAWIRSRHATAMRALDVRGKSADTRCTRCHTDSQNMNDLQLGLRCSACHSDKGVRPTSSKCMECHTELTDPLRRFAQEVKTICGDRSRNTGGHCPR